MNAYEKIGRKLQKAREEAGLSQKELAREVGCTQASLSNYELGKRRLYLAELQRIGDILGKPIGYFLEENEEEKEPSNDMGTILREPYLKEILLAARGLKPSQRESVLEYIEWKKERSAVK
jgi:transcriptional regulator with XRE-family HTH domain